jgi:N-acetylglucosamine-6-phosphate deacetylase
VTDLRAATALVDGELRDGVRVQLHDGVIEAVDSCGGPFDVHLLAPGFVDLQVNGIDDVDVAAARQPAHWERLDALLLQQGTTTWCPTLVTAPLPAYTRRLDAITEAMHRSGPRPTIAGAHLEGPFLGAAHGAHRSEFVIDLDLDWIDQLPPVVRLMTLGPEQVHCAAAIDRLRRRGVVVSLGHTLADDAQCDAAVQAGATLVTHLFNAMSGMHHRTPGVAAWALSEPAVACSLIADGVHVHPRMVAMAMRLLGPRRTVLVTDAVAWRAGTAGEVGVQLRDGAPRLPDGTLAGSALTMDAAVRTCVDAGVPVAHALTAASTTPATVLGLHDRGALAVGARADLVALDPELQVEGVWVAGQRLR